MEPPLSSLETRSFSLRTKTALAMAIVAALVVAAMLGTTFYFRRNQLLYEFQAFVRGVAGTTALALNGDEISTIVSAQDQPSPAFQRARAVIDRSREVNGLAEHELYVLRPIGDSAQAQTEFVVMLQAKAFIGDRYTIPPSIREQFFRAWNTRTPTSTGMYRDEHGQWITGYAPVFNAAGEAIGVVEADAEVSQFMAKQRRELLLALAIGAGAFCIAMIPGLLLVASVTRGLNKLSVGMFRFRAGDPAAYVDVKTGDELEELGSVFNDMIGAIAERLALLPYVSRFTAEAVRRSRDDPTWLSGSEQKVTILFADLRGFTRWCETREARLLVAELNRLLALQADIVVSAGGDVDKFIGDAVMAVFLDDDGPALRIFECACELIERIRSEVTAEGWPLALGVGIHRGSAVVGSIGSPTRRDFTAIGHTVNVASRLCDHAQHWQILVTEDFYSELPVDVRDRFQKTDAIQFKNVEKYFDTFRFDSDAPSAEGGPTGEERA